MSLINTVAGKLDRKFPRFFRALGKVLSPVEAVVKKPTFGCHMCGQCVLHSTGMTCPMECPKNLRNGPCGGVGSDGSCEVDRSMTCVWFKAVNRSEKLPWSKEIFRRNPAVDWSLQGSSAWVNAITGPQSRRSRRARVAKGSIHRPLTNTNAQCQPCRALVAGR